MPQATVKISRDGVLQVSGRIGFDNAPELGRQAEPLILAGSGPLCLDMSTVTFCNSACLALLLAWLRAARKAGRTIEIRNFPENLASLAEIAGITDFLPMTQNAPQGLSDTTGHTDNDNREFDDNS